MYKNPNIYGSYNKIRKVHDARLFFHKFHRRPCDLYLLCDLLITGHLDAIKVEIE